MIEKTVSFWAMRHMIESNSASDFLRRLEADSPELAEKFKNITLAELLSVLTVKEILEACVESE